MLRPLDRVVQIQSAKRQKTIAGGAAWPKPDASTASSDAVAAACSAAAASGAAALQGLATSVAADALGAAAGIPLPPPIEKRESHLKRPVGLALHDLQVHT